MNRDLRARMATLGLIALVFGAGVLAGVAGDRVLGAEADELMAGVPETVEQPDHLSDSEEDEEDRSRGRWMIHRVPLEDGQRVQVDSVLAFYRDQVRELTDTYNEAYWSAVQSTRDELRGILRADQRAHYDSLLADRDKRRGRNDN
jgi:hypothetical protein